MVINSVDIRDTTGMEPAELKEYLNNLKKFLLPCPFCGNEKYSVSFRKKPYTSRNPEYSCAFYCTSCHCRTGRTKYPEQAVVRWNKAKR